MRSHLLTAIFSGVVRWQFTHLQWHLVMAYKLLTEAAGHSGAIAPLSSFPQVCSFFFPHRCALLFAMRSLAGLC